MSKRYDEIMQELTGGVQQTQAPQAGGQTATVTTAQSSGTAGQGSAQYQKIMQELTGGAPAASGAGNTTVQGVGPVNTAQNSKLAAAQRLVQQAKDAWKSTSQDVGFRGWMRRLSEDPYAGYATDDLTYATMYGPGSEAYAAAQEREDRNLTAFKAYEDALEMQRGVEWEQQTGEYFNELQRFHGSTDVMFGWYNHMLEVAEGQGDTEKARELKAQIQSFQDVHDWYKAETQKLAWAGEMKRLFPTGGRDDYKTVLENLNDAQKKYDALIAGRKVTGSSDPRYQQEYDDIMMIAEDMPEDQRQRYIDASIADLNKKYGNLAVNGYTSVEYDNDAALQAAAEELSKWKWIAAQASSPAWRYADIITKENWEAGEAEYEAWKAEDFPSRTIAEEKQDTWNRNYQDMLDVLVYDENNAEEKAAAEQQARNYADWMAQVGSGSETEQNDNIYNEELHPELITPDGNDHDQWTEDEKHIYYALYHVDKEAARQYAAQTKVAHRQALEDEKNIPRKEYNLRNPVTGALSTIGAVAGNIVTGLPDFLSMMGEYNQRGLIAESRFGLGYGSDMTIRNISEYLDTQGDHIPDNIPVIGGWGWGNAYQIGTSILQSAASVGIVKLGVVGAEALSMIPFFGSAASQTTRDALKNDIDAGKAVQMDAWAGLAEVAFEKISLDSLLNKTGLDNYLRHGAAAAIAAQSGVEFSEEAFTELANYAADYLINGGDSELSQRYYLNVINGMSREEAERDVKRYFAGRIAEAGVGGLFSGMIMSSAGIGINAGVAATTTYNGKQYGPTADLMAQGNAQKAGTKSYGLAQRYQAGRYGRTGQLSNLQAGKLFYGLQADDPAGIQGLLDKVGYRMDEAHKHYGAKTVTEEETEVRGTEGPAAEVTAGPTETGPEAGSTGATAGTPEATRGPAVGDEVEVLGEPGRTVEVVGIDKDGNVTVEDESGVQTTVTAAEFDSQYGTRSGGSVGISAGTAAPAAGGIGGVAGSVTREEEQEATGPRTEEEHAERMQAEQAGQPGGTVGVSMPGTENKGGTGTPAGAVDVSPEAGEGGDGAADERDTEGTGEAGEAAEGKTGKAPDGDRTRTPEGKEGRSIQSLRGVLAVATGEGNTEGAPANMTQEQAQQVIIDLAADLGENVGGNKQGQPGLQNQQSTDYEAALARVQRVLQSLEGVYGRWQQRRSDVLEEMFRFRHGTRGEISKATTKDGAEVTVDSLELKDGKLIANVTDAEKNTQTIEADKLEGTFSDALEFMQDMLRNHTADAFNVIQEGQDVYRYAIEFRAAETIGYNGSQKIDSLTGSALVKSLTPEQVRLAYNLGIGMRGREGGTTRSARGTGKITLDGGTLSNGTSLPGVSAEARAKLVDSDDYKYVQALARALEIDVVFFESPTDAEGNYKGANGAYDRGKIYLDINAGLRNRNQTGERMFFRTLSHELTHFIAQNAPREFDKLMTAVNGYLQSTEGLDFNHLIRQKIATAAENGRPMTYDVAQEEVIADACETMLRDSKAVVELAQKEPGLFNAIKNYMKSFFDRILARHTEAKALEPYMKKLQKIWDDALKVAVESRLEGATEIEAVEKLGEDADVRNDDRGRLLAALDEETNVALYSEATYLNGGREKLGQILRENGHTEEEVQKTLEDLDAQLAWLKDFAGDAAVNMGYTNLAEHLAAVITTNVKTGKQALTALVNNGDYPINIDLALICKKRVAYMRLLTTMINDGVFSRVRFGGDAIADVNTLLRDAGFETACLGCFVESRRLQIQKWAESIVQEWNGEVDKRKQNAGYFGFAKGKLELTDAEIDALANELDNAGKKNDKGNLNLGKGQVVERMGRLLDRMPSLLQRLTVADLLTPEGLKLLRSYDQNLFSLVKQRYGSNSPKIVQDFNPYNGEIADLTFKFVKDLIGEGVGGSGEYVRAARKALGKRGKTESKASYDRRVNTLALRNYLYDIGGARIQSFSDFMIENIFDYLQIFNDLAARGLPLHGYSKEIIFLRLFGMTGAKINGSWIAHADAKMGTEYAGLLPVEEAKNGRGIVVEVDGKQYAICMDDVARHLATGSFIQSIGMKDMVALQLDPRYSANVGSITIGVSDKQILAMLDSDYFRMIIPYHASGMLPAFAKLVGVDLYTDYTDFQNTTVKQCYDLQGNPVPEFKNDKGKSLVNTHYDYNKAVQQYGDARAAANAYIAWCADREQHPVYNGKKLVGYAVLNPKFSTGKTDFSQHPNYYKLLEDFTSYDAVTGMSALQGAVKMTMPSEQTRMTAEQKTAYEEALRGTGLFTEAEIQKYLAKADMTMEEMISEEVKGRASYQNQQAKVWDKTVRQVEDLLLEKYGRENKEAASEGGAMFDMRSPYEETADLIAIHNVTEEKLMGALRLGGLPMPSIAVVKAEAGHSNFGDISLVFRKETIDPQRDKRNRIYGADAWTPTYVDVSYFIDQDRVIEAETKFFTLGKQIANGIFAHSNTLRGYGFDQESTSNFDNAVYALSNTEAMQAAYAAAHGIEVTPYYKVDKQGRSVADYDRTANALHNAVKRRDVEAWLRKELDGVIGKPGIWNGKDTFTASGNRRSYWQTHIPYTLENIVKTMGKNQSARGEGARATAPGLQSIVSPEYRTIDEVRADRGRLGRETDEDYAEALQNLEQKLSDLTEAIESVNNLFDNYQMANAIGDLCLQAARTNRSAKSIRNTFTAGGVNITDEQIAGLQEIYREAAMLPTEYFEAKPQRAVGFDEVAAAIIPDNTSESTKKALADAGVNTVEYAAWDEQDRLAKLNGLNDVRFDDRDTESGEYDERVLLKESTIDFLLNKWLHDLPSIYQQAYIVYMNPGDFLDLTTWTPVNEEFIQDLATGLTVENAAKYIAEAQPLFLEVNLETGEVVGHEGRRRNSVLKASKLKRVPVILIDKSGKSLGLPISRLELRAQNFGQKEYQRKRVVVNDLVPFSKQNRQEIVDKFSKEDPGRNSSAPILRFSEREQQFGSREEIDAEIERLQDLMAEIRGAEGHLDSEAHKDPRVQEAQRAMWAAEDEKGRVGSLRERVAYKQILKQVKAELAVDVPEGNVVELEQRVNELKELREQFLKVTPITAAQYDKLAKHFGTTNDYGTAGFILTDGRMLDFSGKKQLGESYTGGREVYHNEVGDVLNLPTDTSPRINMVANGNIRLVPEVNGINLSVKPTGKQRAALRGYINHHNGNVHVDIDNAAGRTIESFGYYNGTAADRVLADIDRYFETGEAPAPQSNLRAFFSERDDARTDRELLMETKGYELTEEQKKALDGYRKNVETYEDLVQKVRAAQEEYAAVVRKGGTSEEVSKARVKLSNLEKRMTAALNVVTGAERGDKTILEIIRTERRIQQQRTRMATNESFSRRELRGRITKLYNDLNRRITNPSEKKNIPVPVMMQAIDVLEAINMDSSREGSKAGQKLRDKLTELRAKYEELKNDPDYMSFKAPDGTRVNSSAAYDEQIAEMLDSMIALVGDTPINRMSANQMRAVLEVLTALDKTARHALIVRMAGEERDAYKVSRAMAEETESVEKAHKNLLAAWLNAQLSPERMFNRLGGHHKDSMWSQVYRMLNDGQLTATQIQMEGSMLYEGLLDGKRYEGFVDPHKTVDIGLKDAAGNAIPITHGMMVSLYMHLQNADNAKHVAHGGLTVPDLRGYYNNKGNRGMDNARHAVGVSQEYADLRDRMREENGGVLDPEMAAELAERFQQSAERYIDRLRTAIERHLTEYDRAWIAAAKTLFDVFSKEQLNRTTMDVYGIKRANVENYFPIWVDGDFLQTPFESVAKDMSLENAGFMKERVFSGKPMRLADVSDVASTQLRRVSQYCGLMPAIRNFGKIWSKVQTGYRGSLQATVRDKFGQAGMNYIENLMADLNGARRGQDGPLGEFFNAVRGNMARASLTLSLRTAMGQPASYPTAASVVGWSALRKALFRGGKSGTMISRADQELIRKYSPLLWYRMKGYSTSELGDLANVNSKFQRMWNKAKWATGWIQAMDGATVGRLWYAAEYAVQERQPGLRKGTDEYYREVAKVFNDVVERTQPDYTTMQRPDILRNPNALVKQLTMFLTQRLQNFNILYDAFAAEKAIRKDAAAGKATQADVQEAAWTRRRAVTSQLAAAATITAFKFLADALLHAMNNYRDDDKDLTKESISIELLDMFLDSLAGNTLGGGEVYDLVEKYAFGKTYYGIDVAGVSTVTDMIDSANKFMEAALKEGADWQTVKPKADRLAKNVASVFGIPLANGEKIANGVLNWGRDIMNGEPLSFEAGVTRTVAQQANRYFRAVGQANFGQAKKIREAVGDDEKLNAALTKLVKTQFEEGKITQQKAVDFLMKHTGRDADAAEKTMRDYSAKLETGANYDEIDDLYAVGDMSAAQAREALVKYGLTPEKAEMKVDWWTYKGENPDTALTQDSFETYWDKYRPLGLTARVYEDFRADWNAVPGVDKNGDGKADSGSKKDERILIIDALPIGSAEKDALYSMNWSTGLEKAPWHTGQSVSVSRYTASTTAAGSKSTGTSKQTAAQQATGIARYGKGNIDLYARDTGLYDSDGYLMTVRSMSFREGNQEVLVPTIVKKNGKWVELTDRQAIDWYRQTGQYLGKFNTVAEADRYAEQLHQQQEILYS